VPWSEKAIAPAVAGLFSPQREALGLDARLLTPLLVQKIVVSGAETRSFARAVKVMDQVGGQGVSRNTIQRVVGDVGGELAVRRDANPKTAEALADCPEEPPELAVVECDGGRIRTRVPDQGPGVHLSGKGWSETKNACLIRATRQTFDEDLQPEPPACFCDPEHVAKLVESEALSIAAPAGNGDHQGEVDEDEPQGPLGFEGDWRAKRLVRTVVSSMACSRQFGRQMAMEAKRRRFSEAAARAFLGDGLGWNWSIWKEQFPEYIPILDFIHPLSYLHATAKAVYELDEDVWSQYLVWMRGCWQGEVDQILGELRLWREKLGLPPADVADTDPRSVVAATITYLQNNRLRMKYPEYRRQGLPVTTAWMESLVKEMNYRVKGTEMFWNDPEGAEAILQVRAASLSDDDRLAKHLATRPGSPFVRRPKPPKLNVEKRKN